jgi:hypothetical protein
MWTDCTGKKRLLPSAWIPAQYQDTHWLRHSLRTILYTVDVWEQTLCREIGGSWINAIVMYKAVQIWPGLTVCKQVTVCPGHIWTTSYFKTLSHLQEKTRMTHKEFMSVRPPPPPALLVCDQSIQRLRPINTFHNNVFGSSHVSTGRCYTGSKYHTSRLNVSNWILCSMFYVAQTMMGCTWWFLIAYWKKMLPLTCQ